jgi:hypothetical protein
MILEILIFFPENWQPVKTASPLKMPEKTELKYFVPMQKIANPMMEITTSVSLTRKEV